MAYIKLEDALNLLSKNSITKKITLADGVSIYDSIAHIPTADVVEVKHGEWRETTQFVISDDPDDDGYWRTIYICSECERTALNKEPYCHCGAKMDGGK